MKSLSGRLSEYLTLRRQLGFKLTQAEFLLKSFVRFAEERNATFITTKLALRWATSPTRIKQVHRASRLGHVRRFASYVSAIDPRTEVPPQKLIPAVFRRQEPYRYTDQNVADLIRLCGQIDPLTEIKGVTLSTLIGLLAVTGMRVGEAMALEEKDVDLAQALLTVRHTKGNRPRLVPLHPSTVEALCRYAEKRDELIHRKTETHFFLWDGGRRLQHANVNRWFVMVLCQAGLRKPGGRRGPRMHDLRSYFAIKTLLNWYRTDFDVEAHLPELSTFLGHSGIQGTYWYLSAVPELLKLATQRLERTEKGRK
jgi:integrase